MKSTCILILGRHRSGTSLVAGTLHHLGVAMYEESFKAGEPNPRGNFEDAEFSALLRLAQPNWYTPRKHDVSECRTQWQALAEKRCEKYPVWGIKQPRICYMLPELRPLIPGRVKAILTEREISASAASLTKCFRKLGFDEALRLCQDVDLARAESFARCPMDTLTVRYEEFVAPTKHRAIVNRIAAFVGLPPTKAAYAFMDPGLNRCGGKAATQMAGMAWRALRERHPWPAERPAVPDHPNKGWLSKGTREMLRRYVPKHETIVELGAFLGLSARFILDAAPHARMVCVDRWEKNEDLAVGHAEALWPVFRETFLARCWDYRERIVPLKMGTLDALFHLANSGIGVDMIYVDAAHDDKSVCDDATTAGRLFPHAEMVGDDWKFDSVQAGVTEAAKQLGRRFDHNDRAWHMAPL